MTDLTRSLPEGAGNTTSSTPPATADRAGSIEAGAALRSATSPGSAYVNDSADVAPQTTGREIVLRERTSSKPSTAAVVGAVIAGAVAAGAIPFMLSGRSASRGPSRSDAARETADVEEMVLIERPARQLYDFWRDFTNFPQFMENIRSVTRLDDRRSHWVIEAPAGTSVEFDSRIVEDVPGSLIAWQSEEGASVPNSGRVEFIEASGGRGTMVRTTISYDPPAGAAGRLVAKLFRREPSVQARRDLRRFKQLMETGSIAGAA